MIALGHIIRVEIKPSEEGSGRYGVNIEAREHDAPIGYGYPRGKSMWFAFDDPRLTTMFNAIRQPVFTDHHDLIGVEVEMTTETGNNGYRDLDVLIGLTVTGGKRRYLESDIERNSREKKTSINKDGDDGVRGRRFYACRGGDATREVIEALPIAIERKRELLNLNAVLTRMIIAENDGQLSEQKLPVF